MYYPLIMAGGAGTRLWPLSRQKYPKQALNLVGDKTLIQYAVDRLMPQIAADHIFVITRNEHVAPLGKQVPEIPPSNFILEPEGRGTAPAIGLAAVHLQRRDPDAVMAVLTADHYIEDVGRFRMALEAAEGVARKGYLVTLGIKPTYPSTGYGYIEQGKLVERAGAFEVYRANRFTEKPEPEAAAQLFESGHYSWNSGMFIWHVERILEEFQRQMPKLYAQLTEVAKALEQPAYERELARIWQQVEKQSIDYGIMEAATDVAVIPVEIGWHDVGSWASVLQVVPTDGDGNIIIGDHVGIDTSNTLVIGEEKLIATIGVEGLVIIDTKDALLVTTKEREQDVRTIVAKLEAMGRDDLL